MSSGLPDYAGGDRVFPAPEANEQAYGVLPQGFSRKSLNTILAEIEASMRTEFGPNVIQTPQSPFGQLNGLMAVLVTQMWEMAEDVYQSYDVDQAEGTRLDTLGKIRLLGRMSNETDAAYRQAINNQDRARIDVQDISRAVDAIDGVTFSHVWVNDSVHVDPYTGLPGGTLCVAVIGGDDAEIGLTLRRYVVPGISLYGNTYIMTTDEGYCRTLVLLRPILVKVKLIVNVAVRYDQRGCPPPALVSIRDAIVAAVGHNGSHELLNGDDVTFFLIRSIVEAKWPNVEVLSIVATAEGHRTAGNTLAITFNELATLAAEDVAIVPLTNTTGIPFEAVPPDAANPANVPSDDQVNPLLAKGWSR